LCSPPHRATCASAHTHTARKPHRPPAPDPPPMPTAPWMTLLNASDQKPILGPHPCISSRDRPMRGHDRGHAPAPGRATDRPAADDRPRYPATSPHGDPRIGQESAKSAGNLTSTRRPPSPGALRRNHGAVRGGDCLHDRQAQPVTVGTAPPVPTPRRSALPKKPATSSCPTPERRVLPMPTAHRTKRGAELTLDQSSSGWRVTRSPRTST